MDELIARLEQAKGPDRDLDAAIVAFQHKAIVKPYPPTDDYGPSNRWQFWSRDGEHFLANEGKWPVPAYTGSIDIALTLVPEGWHWLIDGRPVDASFAASCVKGPDIEEASGPTPAIAVCIAAIEARKRGVDVETATETSKKSVKC